MRGELTFCFRRLQVSQAWAVRWRLSSGTLGRVIVDDVDASADSPWTLGSTRYPMRARRWSLGWSSKWPHDQACRGRGRQRCRELTGYCASCVGAWAGCREADGRHRVRIRMLSFRQHSSRWRAWAAGGRRERDGRRSREGGRGVPWSEAGN